MPIKYYPDSTVKKFPHVVEKLQKGTRTYTVEGTQDMNVAALAVRVWAPAPQWQVSAVSFHFSSANAKNYAAEILRGRGIVKNLNDRLYFSANRDIPQEIILTEAFYTGTELAAHLKAKMDADATFVANGTAPFTISYSPTTGLFTIAPAAGTIQYIDNNTTRNIRNYSTAGLAFGFTADSVFAASITNDTPVYHLGTSAQIGLTASASTNTDTFSNEVLPMDVDVALALSTNSTVMTVDYRVVYGITY